MELLLWFQHTPKIELVQIEFCRSGADRRRVYRGKAAAIHPDAGLFQWTSAVKAFSSLVAGYRLAIAQGEEDFCLEGEGGSPAASLDYSISKPTTWIVDLFGRATDGAPYARRVFKRENSERKRSGPVRVSLSNSLAEPGAIRLFVDGHEAGSIAQLSELVSELSQDKKGGDRKPESINLFKAIWFRRELEKEVSVALKDLSVLELSSIDIGSARLGRVRGVPRKAVESIVGELKVNLPDQSKRYLVPKLARLKKRLSIALPPMAVGALAILRALGKLDGNIALNCKYPSASAILEDRTLADYDAIVLSWGAAAKFRSSQKLAKYRAALMLPRTTFHLVTDGAVIQPKKILLAMDQFGYPLQIFKEMIAQKRFSAQVRSIDASLSEIMNLFGVSASAAILSYPFSQLISKRHNASCESVKRSGVAIGDNILFVRDHRRIDEVQGAILASWYKLLSEEELLKSSIDAIFSDLDFVNYLYRLAALYNLGEEVL